MDIKYITKELRHIFISANQDIFKDNKPHWIGTYGVDVYLVWEGYRVTFMQDKIYLECSSDYNTIAYAILRARICNLVNVKGMGLFSDINGTVNEFIFDKIGKDLCRENIDNVIKNSSLGMGILDNSIKFKLALLKQGVLVLDIKKDNRGSDKNNRYLVTTYSESSAIAIKTFDFPME